MTDDDARRPRRRLTQGLIPGLVAAGLGLASGPPGAMAQDAGRTATLSFDETLRITDNPGLVPNPSEAALISRTSLGFGLVFLTPVDRLAFDAGGFFEFGKDVDSGFQSPTVGARYTRQGATSRFALDARWRERDIRTTFALPTADDLGADPADPAEPDPAEPPPGDDDITFDEQDLITDDGTVQDIRVGTALDVGVGTPTELSFGLEYRRRDYSGTTDPDLFDDERMILSASADLRINPAVTGLIDTRYELYTADDATSTERKVFALGTGARMRVDDTVGLEALVFYDRVETSRTTGDDTDEGVGARLGIAIDRPLGGITGEVRTQITATGRRDTVRVGQRLDLRDGTIAGEIGAVRFSDGTIRPSGALRFRRALRDGALSVTLNQTAAVDDEDNNVIRTALAAGLTRQVNSVSSLNGQVSLAAIDVVDGDSSYQVGLTLGYSRTLTRDWSLDTGYQLTIRDGSASQTRTSNTLFVSVGRDFDLRF